VKRRGRLVAATLGIAALVVCGLLALQWRYFEAHWLVWRLEHHPETLWAVVAASKELEGARKIVAQLGPERESASFRILHCAYYGTHLEELRPLLHALGERMEFDSVLLARWTTVLRSRLDPVIIWCVRGASEEFDCGSNDPIDMRRLKHLAIAWFTSMKEPPPFSESDVERQPGGFWWESAVGAWMASCDPVYDRGADRIAPRKEVDPARALPLSIHIPRPKDAEALKEATSMYETTFRH
jgi:hypothetical protein